MPNETKAQVVRSTIRKTLGKWTGQLALPENNQHGTRVLKSKLNWTWSGSQFIHKISAWASETKPSGALFREKFIGYKILPASSINSMMDTLTINGVIENQQLVCVGITKCGQIKHLKWEKDLRGYTHVMEDQCRKLCSIETADYSAEIEKFTGGLITLITNSIMRMIRGELIDPVSGVAAGFLYSLYEKQQLAQKSTEQELAEKAKRSRAAEELKVKKTGAKTNI